MDLTEDYYLGPAQRATALDESEEYITGDPLEASQPSDASAVFIREDDETEPHEPHSMMEVDPFGEDEDKKILCELVGHVNPENQFSTNQCAVVKKEPDGDEFKFNFVVKEDCGELQKYTEGPGENNLTSPQEKEPDGDEFNFVLKEDCGEMQYTEGPGENNLTSPQEQFHENEQKPLVTVKEERDLKEEYSDDDRDVDFGDKSDNQNGNVHPDIGETDMSSQHTSQVGRLRNPTAKFLRTLQNQKLTIMLWQEFYFIFTKGNNGSGMISAVLLQDICIYIATNFCTSDTTAYFLVYFLLYFCIRVSKNSKPPPPLAFERTKILECLTSGSRPFLMCGPLYPYDKH